MNIIFMMLAVHMLTTARRQAQLNLLCLLLTIVLVYVNIGNSAVYQHVLGLRSRADVQRLLRGHTGPKPMMLLLHRQGEWVYRAVRLP